LLSHLLRDRRANVGERRRRDPACEQRDVVLAALSYRELAERNALAGTLLLDMQRMIEQRLVVTLKDVLARPHPAITMVDRIAGARVLGALGDPRVPTDLRQWRQTLRRERPQQFKRSGAHYWRYVPGGRYQIGGWDEGEASAKLELADFWVARLTLTVAQFALFLEAGGYQDERWWTPEGWRWKAGRAEPWQWDDTRFNGRNQPVVGVSWYEATAYCAWLSEQLAQDLPDGYVLRLPSEAEWEAAASADGQGGRRIYPWGSEDATPERAIYNVHQLGAAVPVGCCPAGATACGALDMVGNVWEWTSSSLKAYPAEAYAMRKDFTTDEYNVPLRGHAYYGNGTDIRCGARHRYGPGIGNLDIGFRVFVAPRLAG
jgi:formylglycine-generating enzyme required for sulfatase activity